MFSFIFSLLIGALAGYIAGRIMGSETSALRNIVLGILGSFVGGILFGLVGLSATGLVGEIIVSVIGACVCIWAGRKLPEMKDVIDAAHALREQGIAHVVISLGEEGALWVNASGEWIAKPPSVEVVSTVGAGDSMVGGLIYGLLMRESSEHTLRLATAVAALAVSQSNVGITDRTQLAAMMARVDLQPFN